MGLSCLRQGEGGRGQRIHGEERKERKKAKRVDKRSYHLPRHSNFKDAFSSSSTSMLWSQLQRTKNRTEPGDAHAAGVLSGEIYMLMNDTDSNFKNQNARNLLFWIRFGRSTVPAQGTLSHSILFSGNLLSLGGFELCF